MVICLERDADLHMSQLMPLPFTAFCFRKIQIGFTFLVPAHPGSPRKRAVKRLCVFLTLKPCWLHQQNHSTRDCFPQPAAEIRSLKEAEHHYCLFCTRSITTACSAHGASLLLVLCMEHHYCLFCACLWVCSATFLTISSRFQIAGGSEDLHLMMVESHQPVGTLTKHTITHCILKQYWTVEIKCTKHCIPASSSVCKLQTDLTTAVVKYNEIYWNCLQCFHAVGLAAGRASGL